MDNLYEHIERLAKSKGFKNITEFCRVADIPRATMSELKVGRTKRLSAETLSKIAAHLNVPVDYLLGKEESDWCFAFRQNLREAMSNYDSYDCAEAGVDQDWIYAVANGDVPLTFETACDVADVLGESFDSLLGRDYPNQAEENKKAPTNGERDVLDEVDVAFYGDFKELNEDEKETIRDMVRLMRQRKDKRSQ